MNFARFFRTSFFTEHVRITASILQQLLALYFAIICSMCRWQLSSGEESLVGKNHPYISGFLQT